MDHRFGGVLSTGEVFSGVRSVTTVDDDYRKYAELFVAEIARSIHTAPRDIDVSPLREYIERLNNCIERIH